MGSGDGEKMLTALTETDTRTDLRAHARTYYSLVCTWKSTLFWASKLDYSALPLTHIYTRAPPKVVLKTDSVSFPTWEEKGN